MPLNKFNQLFKKVRSQIEAYGSLIKDHESKNGKITNFKEIPVIDKYSYINKYPLSSRMSRNAHLSDFYTICSSSGSTGQSTLWPRDSKKDRRVAQSQIHFLNEHFNINSVKTLIVLAMELGTSQAGLMHLKASWECAKHKGVTTISPNKNVEQAASLITEIHSNFTQIILLGYPPLIEEILTVLLHSNQLNKITALRIATTGENVNDKWRSRMSNLFHIPLSSIMAFYGSTETGLIGYETPALNQLISLMIENPVIRKEICTTSPRHFPTLIALNDHTRYFEIVNDEIIVTTNQTIPLIRYNLHDVGQIITSKQIRQILLKHHHSKQAALFNKPSKYLAVYYRNTGRYFSIEDIKNAIELIKKLSVDNEFYYHEEIAEDKLILHLHLFSDLATQKVSNKKSAQTSIQQQLSLVPIDDKTLKLKLIWHKISEKKGYENGKIKYLI